LKIFNCMKKKYLLALIVTAGCSFPQLFCQINPDILKQRGWVSYSEFGAKGDGKSDDIGAIAATHEFANKHNLKVKADKNATYYIGGRKMTVDIQTDTDFSNATFIIDDTSVEDRTADIFSVNSVKQSFKPAMSSPLKKSQERVDIALPGPSLITVTNSNVKRYIRFGPNQNNGSSQTDIFIVDKNGVVDKNTPIIWDFDQITDMTVLPIDETILTISGGRFITIANREESKYNYYSRGIHVRRSNVIIDGLEHRVTGEGEHGAPYGGFISISNSTHVTVKNTLMTGHKVYRTIGSAGVPVSMGTYDISITRALNITFKNCSQTNDINDPDYWGIMGSNYCKNIVYDNCTFSRFDAHVGVANATIRNSTLGHQGINAIGCGTFTLENSTIYGTNLVNLRSDYGSTWEGEFFIRNCRFVPRGLKSGNVSLISGYNSGQHDFGYTCYMPSKITIENLQIDDSAHPEGYRGPAIFANFNKEKSSEGYVEKYPFITTKTVVLKNVSTASGLPIRISDNGFMFKDVVVVK
jgi:membrane-bound inhibitor of C-type lysozyme